MIQMIKEGAEERRKRKKDLVPVVK